MSVCQEEKCEWLDLQLSDVLRHSMTPSHRASKGGGRFPVMTGEMRVTAKADAVVQGVSGIVDTRNT